jgi:hypothetical protein
MQTDGWRDDKEQGDIVGQQSRRERRSQNKKKGIAQSRAINKDVLLGVVKIKKEPK